MLRNQKNWKLDSSDFRQIASLLMLIKQKNLSLPGSLAQVKSVINSRLDSYLLHLIKLICLLNLAPSDIS